MGPVELNPWILLIGSIRELPWFYGILALVVGWIALVKAPQWRARVREQLCGLLKSGYDDSRALAHIGAGIAIDRSGNRFVLVDHEHGVVLGPEHIVDVRLDDSKSRHRLMVLTSSPAVPKVEIEAFWEADVLDRVYKSLAEMRWRFLTSGRPLPTAAPSSATEPEDWGRPTGAASMGPSGVS
jgi:hypothetical protein